MNIVITGDRSAHPAMAVTVVQQLIIKELVGKEEGTHLKLVTGLEQGVEAAVRLVAKAAGLEVIDLQWMSKEWDEYALALSEQAPTKVYFIHGDAMASKLYPALTKSVIGDKVELIAPELVFA